MYGWLSHAAVQLYIYTLDHVSAEGLETSSN